MILQFCQWLENTPWGFAVRDSTWAYPYVQLIHFTGLSLFVGTIILLNLRMLGWIRRDETLAEVYDRLSGLMWVGFCIALLGGFLLFSSAAGAFYYNPAFRWKMVALVFALLWHILVLWKVKNSGASLQTPNWARLAGLVSLALFVCVVTGAVLIPNY
jgi:hypothetical protein